MTEGLCLIISSTRLNDQNRYSRTTDVTLFTLHGANITHNAAAPLCDIPGSSLSDYKHRPLEPYKALYYCFVSQTGGVTLKALTLSRRLSEENILQVLMSS